MKEKKDITIAVIEDDRDAWVRLCRVLEAEGYKVNACLVMKDDTAATIAEWLPSQGEPDILVIDDHLGMELRGIDVLRALGGKYLAPANPRVVVASGDPSLELLAHASGHFRAKTMLRLPDQEGWKGPAKMLYALIEASIGRLGL